MIDPERICPKYHRAVELIGRRWTGAIVVLLLRGKSRFHELSECIPQMSDRMLSERLKELESEGIVSRIVTPATPVKVEYLLTPKGRALEGAVTAIQDWAEDWVSAGDGAAAEAAAGDPVSGSGSAGKGHEQENTLASG